MAFDLTVACRMAKASDVPYYIDKPGGAASCPFYGDLGFKATPQVFVADGINAALVGTTASEIVLAFRGTVPIDTDDWNGFVESVLDWANDGEATLVARPYTSGLVHDGFAKALDSLWEEVLGAVRAQQTAGGKLPLVVTGHSKGGALASLAAVRLRQAAGIMADAVYTFGSPRAGNTAFARDFGAKVPSAWRFENTDDLVPHLPPTALLLSFLAQADPRLSVLSAHGYQHVGLLEFFNWSGGITEGSTLALDADRMFHLAKLALTGQVRQVAQDHGLEKQYIARVCKGA